MYKTIKYDDIERNRENINYALIDVRSPSEYRAQTIPQAINIPIFNDEDRKLIGTIYTKESIQKAKKVGVETAAKHLPDIYDKVSKLDKQYDKLIFFCARGGLRSSSLVSLFMPLGINAFKLDCGYKGYRKHINTHLPNLVKQIKFIVLYGNTGVGKTHILEALREKGMDILDLEGCANHRGSVLGSVGLGKQNTQKMFESLVYQSLINRKTNLVFVEGESKRIGNDIIPNYLYDAMTDGINIRIEAGIETRIDNILKDYVHNTDEELIYSLNFLRNQLGNKNIDRYIELIHKHEYKKVIKELIIKYYDPLYQYKKRKYNRVFYNENTLNTAEDIVNWGNALTQYLE